MAARQLSRSCSPVALELARAAVAAGLVQSEVAEAEHRTALQLTAHVSGVRVEEWHQVRQLLAEQTEKVARSSSNAGHCQSCGQAVRWTVTVNGRRMPLDPLPHPRGNVELRPLGSQLTAFVHANSELPLQVDRAYRAHAATCPNRRPPTAAPAKVTQLVRTCRVCKKPMDADLFAAGERTHPCCDPTETQQGTAGSR